eukprot:COSAG06_NODE_4512_length_4191_cov_14.122678_4_plen_95_part_00
MALSAQHASQAEALQEARKAQPRQSSTFWSQTARREMQDRAKAEATVEQQAATMEQQAAEIEAFKVRLGIKPAAGSPGRLTRGWPALEALEDTS